MGVPISGIASEFQNSTFLVGGLRIGGTQVLPGGTTGSVFFVDSVTGSSANDGKTPQTAKATISQGAALCTANKGDIVIVMPGHAETLAAAADISVAVAGCSIVGLGFGSLRPQLTYSTSANATFAITANAVQLSNMAFIGNVSNVVAGITTTKADTQIFDCVFRNAGTNLDFLTPIKATSTTNNDSDGLRVENCRWLGNDSDDLEFIEINANLDRFVCNNNYVFNLGTASPLILVATGKLLTQADIGWNRLFNQMTANELFISNDGTTNTGVIHNNYVGHKDVTGTHDPGWDGGGFRLFNNLSTSVDNLQGVVVPAIDVNL